MNIKNIIREEIDDLKWIEDTPDHINIFYDVDNALYVDVPITKDELKVIIRDIYDSGGILGDVHHTADEYIEATDNRNGGTLDIVLGWSRNDGFTISKSFGFGLHHYGISFGRYTDERYVVHKYSETHKPNNMNESNDFDWADDIQPIPNGIVEVFDQPAGEYKVWLGDIPNSQQIGIITYIVDRIKDGDMETSTSLGRILDNVVDNQYSINSLYFEVSRRASMTVSMMCVYSYDDQEEKFEYSREFFDEETTSVELY